MTTKEIFNENLRSTDRDGVEELIKWLETTDFYTAPASIVYHDNEVGGLITHSLNVMYDLLEINKKLGLPDDSVIICSLLHDVSKAGFYEEAIKGKKEYCSDGDKFDDFGRFKWVNHKTYTVKPGSERLTAGSHGFNSVLIVNRFIKLSEDEMVAILNHHAGMDDGYCLKDLNDIYNKNKLAAALHIADMQAVYLD